MFSVFSPAKLNLFLAITGRRGDGFHDLVSVVTPLEFGDLLSVTITARSGSKFELTCSDPAVPRDDSNLVLRAAKAFAGAVGWGGSAAFALEKRIPMGAGMGGGSSNAAAALRALNGATGHPLHDRQLTDLAATLGSDCPLFLSTGPVVMRGRGEQLQALPGHAAARLRGRRVLVFKPGFGVPTAWAYGKMAAEAAAMADPDDGDPVYLPATAAEQRLSSWINDASAPAEALLFNNMERPAFRKYVALPALLEQLRLCFDLQPRMTGSGSACFALLPEGAPVSTIVETIHRAWGQSALVVESRLT